MSTQSIICEAIARHYEKKAARADQAGRGATAWFHREWAAKARAGRTNPLVLRVWRRFVQPKVGQLFDTPSGMGGTFTVKLIRDEAPGVWIARVYMPRNPDWHGVPVGPVGIGDLLPVRG